jgi:hypothetical protein
MRGKSLVAGGLCAMDDGGAYEGIADSGSSLGPFLLNQAQEWDGLLPGSSLSRTRKTVVIPTVVGKSPYE